MFIQNILMWYTFLNFIYMEDNQNQIVLSRPVGKMGQAAKILLDESGVEYTTIYNEDEEVVLHDPASIYPWKGIAGVQSFLAVRPK